MTPEKRAAKNAQSVEINRLARIAARKPKPCTDCGEKFVPTFDHRLVCPACKAKRAVKVERTRNEARRIHRAKAIACDVASKSVTATTTRTDMSRNGKPGSGIVSVTVKPEHKAHINQRIDAIAWAANQEGYKPGECSKWIARYFEMIAVK